MDIRCANCDWTGTDEQANPAKDIEHRHSIGCVYSDLECPECEALCYPVEATEFYPWAVYVTCKDEAEKKVRQAAPDLLTALKDLTRVYESTTGQDVFTVRAHAAIAKAEGRE